MTTTLKIAVLMTCFNRKAATLRCLELLNHQQGLREQFDLNIYLVDDGSTDGTGEAVRHTFPGMNIIAGDGNLFWNRGMNKAWRAAAPSKPDYFLWMNDDTFLFEDAITQLQSISQDHPDSIVAGHTISETTKQLTYGGFSLSNNKLIPMAGNTEAVDYFNGNCVLISYSVFSQVGFLDDRFHHALGDFDYGLRAGKIGIQSLVAGSPVGTCEAHTALPRWFNPANNISKRFKALYQSSSSCNPAQYFQFEKRHYGLTKAIFHYLSIHLRAAWPGLWK